MCKLINVKLQVLTKKKNNNNKCDSFQTYTKKLKLKKLYNKLFSNPWLFYRI